MFVCRALRFLPLTVLCGGTFPPFEGADECRCILDNDYFTSFAFKEDLDRTFGLGFNATTYGRGCSYGHSVNEKVCRCFSIYHCFPHSFSIPQKNSINFRYLIK